MNLIFCIYNNQFGVNGEIYNYKKQSPCQSYRRKWNKKIGLYLYKMKLKKEIRGPGYEFKFEETLWSF